MSAPAQRGGQACRSCSWLAWPAGSGPRRGGVAVLHLGAAGAVLAAARQWRRPTRRRSHESTAKGCGRYQGVRLDLRVGSKVYRRRVSTYRFSQLAERSGVPATTLRYYESVGLLAAERMPAGYRLYDDEAVRRLEFIRACLAWHACANVADGPAAGGPDGDSVDADETDRAGTTS